MAKAAKFEVKTVKRDGKTFVVDRRGNENESRTEHSAEGRWHNSAAVSIKFRIPIDIVKWRLQTKRWPGLPDGSLQSRPIRAKNPRDGFYCEEFILESWVAAAVKEGEKKRPGETPARFRIGERWMLRRWELSRLFHVAAGARANAIYKKNGLSFDRLRSPITAKLVYACFEDDAHDALKRFRQLRLQSPMCDHRPTVSAVDFSRRICRIVTGNEPPKQWLPRVPKSWYLPRTRLLKCGDVRTFPPHCRHLCGRKLRFVRRHTTSGGPQLFFDAEDVAIIEASLKAEVKGEIPDGRGGLGKADVRRQYGYTARMLERWGQAGLLHPVETSHITPGRNVDRRQKVYSPAELDTLAATKCGKIRAFDGVYDATPGNRRTNIRRASQEKGIPVGTIHRRLKKQTFGRERLAGTKVTRPGASSLRNTSSLKRKLTRPLRHSTIRLTPEKNHSVIWQSGWAPTQRRNAASFNQSWTPPTFPSCGIRSLEHAACMTSPQRSPPAPRPHRRRLT